MTNLPELFDEQGQRVALQRQLGSGGEGAVFTLPNDSSLVAKVYHRPPSAQTAEKLGIMVAIAHSQLLKVAAWPKSLLYHGRTRQLAGFLMPRLSDCQPIQQLYNPVQRLKCFPRAGWDFQVRAAVNLAAAFDEVHKAGGLVGDVNQSNVQVSSQALIRLIDCDSFQIQAKGKSFLCEVGVAHYIPPELQGKSLRGLVRSQNHDRFGLAVLIYQLLFVGRHPYAGVYRGPGDPSFEQLIAEYRFAQGPAASTWGMSAPPYTPTFADIPTDLGLLFRRAFERGSESGTRPRPADWCAALQGLEHAFEECADDPGHKYWANARSCVWCRLAAHGGPEYYFDVAGGGGTFAVEEAKLQKIIARLQACGPVALPFNRKRYMPAQPLVAEPLPPHLNDYRSSALILAVAIGLCLCAMPLGFFIRGMGLFGFLGSLTFGVWLAVHYFRSPWYREYSGRLSARNRALRNLEAVEEAWKQTVVRFRKAREHPSRSAEILIAQCRELGPRYQAEIQEIVAHAQSNARKRHLRLHLITDADIPLIGASRKQMLASNQIFTAADVEEYRVLETRGFGEALTRSLLEWKEDVLRRFRFDPKESISPSDHKEIRLNYQTSQQKILAELEAATATLEALTPACRAELQKLTPDLKQALAQLEQAECNLKLLQQK